MLSRIADSMFWLNRYMERSDGLLRGVKTHYTLLLDKGINENLSWRPMLEIYTYSSEEEIRLLQDNSEAVIHQLFLDTTNINSLKILINKARENARGMQDHITKEVWEQINQIYHFVNQPAYDQQLKGFQFIDTVDALANQCILYNGVSDTTMPRGMGWNFMSLGKYIERCLLTIEMTVQYLEKIEYKLDVENDILQWRPLLLALSGYELHLKTYRSNQHNQNTIHQVLFNENFTRSILYTLKRIDKYFNHILGYDINKEKEDLAKLLGRLVSKFQYADFDSLNQLTLQKFLSDTRKELLAFSNGLGQSFFSYS